MMIESCAGDPAAFIARAVELAGSRPALMQAVRFIGNADGSRGADLRVELVFHPVADKNFRWFDAKGQCRRETCPSVPAELERWLKSFFEAERAAMTPRTAPAAPEATIEIEPVARPRKAKGGQMSLF
jgi:hypothetical protein